MSEESCDTKHKSEPTAKPEENSEHRLGYCLSVDHVLIDVELDLTEVGGVGLLVLVHVPAHVSCPIQY